jgi:beta-lactamase class A
MNPLSSTFSSSPLARFSPSDLAALVSELEAQCGGTLHFAVRDLQTGDTLRCHADERCKTASVIKLPILVHIALCVREGSLSWDEKMALTDAEKVDGSGVLTQLTAGLELSLRDVCTLMTVVSDNTGTNMVIERVGTEAVNSRMSQLGLPVTTCFRKAYSPDTEASKAYGLGVTTPDEMLALLIRLAGNEIGDEAVSKDILHILAGQFYRDAIPRLLPEDWKYRGKTGAVDAVRNDVGIVEMPDGRRYALALFCQNLPIVQWTADNPGLLALARLTRHLLI